MRTALAIDIGGTELRLALVGEDGTVRARRRTATDAAGGPEAVLAQIAGLAEGLDLAGAGPAGIGVGCPGPLDAEAGTVTGPPTLAGWDGYPLAARLGERFGLPATLGNDGHAAALGEWRFGAGRGLSDFVYITVSTGIGGGIISGGRLITGRGGLAGHVGHMRVTDAPVRCSCGIAGCLEAVASGTALGRAARAAAAADPAGAIARLAGDAPADARHAGLAAREGDPAARAAIEAVARHLGTGIASLVHLLAPERVVIGGGLAALLDLMQPTIEAVLEAGTMPAFRPVAVVAAGLGRDVGLVGAAMLALDPPGTAPLSFPTRSALPDPEPQQRTSP